MPKLYRVTIWEKAEHWTFEETIYAEDDKHMIKLIHEIYPRKQYSIRSWINH